MPTEPQPSPRQERRAQIARRLASEGLRLMAERGIAGCKVADIAAAAGVAKGSFFSHFVSKDAFVASLLAGVLKELARRLAPLGLGVNDPETILADVAAAIFRFFQLNPQAASLLNQALALPPEGEACSQARRCLAEHLEMLGDKIAPAAKALGWPGERAAELALALLAMASGYAWLGNAVGLGGGLPLDLSERLSRALARGLER